MYCFPPQITETLAWLNKVYVHTESIRMNLCFHRTHMQESSKEWYKSLFPTLKAHDKEAENTEECWGVEISYLLLVLTSNSLFCHEQSMLNLFIDKDIMQNVMDRRHVRNEIGTLHIVPKQPFIYSYRSFLYTMNLLILYTTAEDKGIYKHQRHLSIKT